MDVVARLTSDADWATYLLAWQRQVVSSIARGAPLKETLAVLCRLSEEHTPDRKYSVLLVSPDGKHLVSGAGPSLPPAYNAAIDGIEIGPHVGSCGTAAHEGKPVVVGDISCNPLWADFKDLALEHGLRACWSTPIFSSGGKLLGTWAIYSMTPGEPNRRDRQVMEAATWLAAVAIERDQVEQERSALVRTAQAEAHLNSRMAALTTLVATELDSEKLPQLITDEATKLCEAAFGAFFFNRVNDQGENYTLYTISGVPRERFSHFPMPRNTAVFGPTFHGLGTVRHDDVTKAAEYGRNAPYHGIPKGHLPVRSYLAVSVKNRGGEVMGGLFFGHPEPARFTAEHQRAVEAVAGLAAVAIQNAKLYSDLRRSEEQARAAVEQARQADRRKDEFLAMLGHELRNPLSPILTALEIIQLRGVTGIEQERAIITRQVDHLVRLVDDLLDVSRITQGKVVLHHGHHAVADLVSRAIEIAGPLLESHGHRLGVDVEPQLAVEADGARVAQVVANLLTNSAKYTPPGGDIQVRAWRDGPDVALEVSDNGIGIDADLLPRVFDTFVQGYQTSNRAQGGLGLGLSIVRSLVALHGGTVEAESAGRGHGSRFRIRLPAAAPADAPQARSEATVPEGRGSVLIVDDNEDAAATLATAANLLGFRAEVAHDGPEALKVLESFAADAVLLDIGLPVMDGYELARRLRSRFGRAIRLVAVSGYGQDEDRRRSSEAGVDLHLVKPIDLAGLASAIAPGQASAANPA